MLCCFGRRSALEDQSEIIETMAMESQREDGDLSVRRVSFEACHAVLRTAGQGVMALPFCVPWLLRAGVGVGDEGAGDVQTPAMVPLNRLSR